MVFNLYQTGDNSMEIKFKILEIDNNQHSIVVRYFTDYFTEDNLASSFTTDQSGQPVIDRRPDGSPIRCQTDYNINIWKAVPTPTEKDIIAAAQQGAPYDWFNLKYDVINPNVDTTLSNAIPLIGNVFTCTKPITYIEEDIQAEIQKLIDSIVQ